MMATTTITHTDTNPSSDSLQKSFSSSSQDGNEIIAAGAASTGVGIDVSASFLNSNIVAVNRGVLRTARRKA